MSYDTPPKTTVKKSPATMYKIKTNNTEGQTPNFHHIGRAKFDHKEVGVMQIYAENEYALGVQPGMEEPEARDRKWFRCDMCDEEFLIERFLKDHILKFHGSDSEQICTTCGKPCGNVGIKIEKNDDNVAALQAEIEEPETRDSRWFRCDMCGEEFVIGRQLKDHILKSHGSDLQNSTTTCGDEGIKIEVGVLHIYAKNEPALIAQPEIKSPDTPDRKWFQCDMCGQEFSRQRLLKDHILKFHGSDFQCLCTTCGKPCSDDDDDAAAVQAEMEEPETRDRKWFKCHMCSQEFSKECLLKDHVMTSHGSDSPNNCITPITDSIKIKEDQTGVVHIYAKKGAAFKALPEMEERDRKWFGCDLCNEEFLKERLLKDHILKSHGSNSQNKCTVCGTTFKDENKLRKHILKHHGEHSSQCEVCDEAITDVNPLNVELPTCTTRTTRSKALKRKDQTVVHFTAQKKKKPLKCDQCDITFNDKKQLSEHTLTHGGGDDNDDNNDDSTLYVCAQCHEVFKEEADLNEHHATNKICAKTKRDDKLTCESSQLDSLSVHTKDVNGQKSRYQCAVCNKQFKKTSRLVVHLSVHSEEKPFQCAVCNKKFKTKAYLMVHLSLHSEEKPFQCSQCNKCFRKKNNLDKHMFTHSDVKRYKCAECGKEFRSRKGHDEHVLTHTGNSSVKCKICGKLFICQSRLERHMVSHSNTKPYRCTLCGKSYSQQGHLKRHVDSVHSDIKPFKCSECGKGFTLKQYLGEHLHSHFGRSRFQCKKCGKKFKARQTLKKHVLEHERKKPHAKEKSHREHEKRMENP